MKPALIALLCFFHLSAAAAELPGPAGNCGGEFARVGESQAPEPGPRNADLLGKALGDWMRQDFPDLSEERKKRFQEDLAVALYEYQATYHTGGVRKSGLHPSRIYVLEAEDDFRITIPAPAPSRWVNTKIAQPKRPSKPFPWLSEPEPPPRPVRRGILYKASVALGFSAALVLAQALVNSDWDRAEEDPRVRRINAAGSKAVKGPALDPSPAVPAETKSEALLEYERRTKLRAEARARLENELAVQGGQEKKERAAVDERARIEAAASSLAESKEAAAAEAEAKARKERITRERLETELQLAIEAEKKAVAEAAEKSRNAADAIARARKEVTALAEAKLRLATVTREMERALAEKTRLLAEEEKERAEAFAKLQKARAALLSVGRELASAVKRVEGWGLARLEAAEARARAEKDKRRDEALFTAVQPVGPGNELRLVDRRPARALIEHFGYDLTKPLGAEQRQAEKIKVRNAASEWIAREWLRAMEERDKDPSALRRVEARRDCLRRAGFFYLTEQKADGGYLTVAPSLNFKMEYARTDSRYLDFVLSELAVRYARSRPGLYEVVGKNVWKGPEARVRALASP